MDGLYFPTQLAQCLDVSHEPGSVRRVWMTPGERIHAIQHLRDVAATPTKPVQRFLIPVQAVARERERIRIFLRAIEVLHLVAKKAPGVQTQRWSRLQIKIRHHLKNHTLPSSEHRFRLS